MMDWKREAERDLRAYLLRQQGLESLRERMQALGERMYAVRSAVPDALPVQGGGAEDRLTNCIAERERLKNAYAATKRLVDITERGLAVLTDTERRVLELFYIRRERGHVERLMEELGYEQSRVYQLKNAALERFTIACYGVLE